MEQLILDHMLKEEFSFPDPSFPIQFYIDDLHQWPDGQVPLHWHFGYEIFSAFNQEVTIQVGEKRLTLLPGESILIGGGQLHRYSLTDSTRECLCPNIVFTENVLAPLTSTIFQKYFLPSTPRSQLAVHKVIAICTLAKTNVVVPLPSLSAYRRRSGLCYTAFQHLLIKTKSYRMSRIGSTSKFI